MEQDTQPEELKQMAAEPKDDMQQKTQEEDSGNRRSFLTRAAIGVTSAAGMIALGTQAGQAAESGNAAAKSKILERIRLQMSQQDIEPIDEGGGGDAYIKNAHSLYLKK